MGTEEDDQLEALFTRKRFRTLADVVQWATQDIMIPLLRIARSDAPQSEREAQIDRLLAEWDFEIEASDPLV
jgi:hypothetical protein